jgi:hypothetical protein
MNTMSESAQLVAARTGLKAAQLRLEAHVRAKGYEQDRIALEAVRRALAALS